MVWMDFITRRIDWDWRPFAMPGGDPREHAEEKG